MGRALDSLRASPPALERGAGATQPRKVRRRSWLIRRVLLTADVLGLLCAFLVTELLLADFSAGVDPRIVWLFLIFLLSLPSWVLAAKLYGLYDLSLIHI